SGRIRVVIADDHRILRQGLIALLRAESNIDVVGEASDGIEAIELARTLGPDVIVMDVTMPRMNGIEATRQITAELPRIRIIGLSMHEDDAIATSMREAGAVDFVTKGGRSDTLVAAIQAAAQGGFGNRAG
ncbi:MAG: response regulator transcription factor, partial [Acidithiobacillales bacterium]